VLFTPCKFKTLELSYDLPEVEKLRTKAKPITEKIKSDLLKFPDGFPLPVLHVMLRI